MTQPVSRRKFLQLSAVTATSAFVVACGGGPAAAPAEEAAPAAADGGSAAGAEAAAGSGQYREAPMLTEMVNAGTLPPVDERLPVAPRTIPVVEEIGEYGGTWFRAAVGPGDAGTISNRLSYENLLRWTEDGGGVIPNIAESYEVNDDATEFTFTLREGMKWSDGAPFTADDYLFVYEDILGNEELSPAFPSWLTAPNGEPGVIEKVDDYTIKFVFTTSYGLFLQILAGPSSSWISDRPKHYLTQFHPSYADQAELDAMVAEAGFEEWIQLFGDRHNWQNPEMPHI